MVKQNVDRRLADLERGRQGPATILVCWCARQDGKHNEDCPCYGQKIDRVITWEDEDGGTWD